MITWEQPQVDEKPKDRSCRIKIPILKPFIYIFGYLSRAKVQNGSSQGMFKSRTVSCFGYLNYGAKIQNDSSLGNV